ncbi:MAG: asparagine synthase (glutamine-hydrolyzing) [Polyangiaceae bacterium]
MCGFVGVLNLDDAPAQPELLSRMSREIAHRGPDDAGVESIGPCGLAFRRLAIIDLSAAGHQPMKSADGRFTVVFNGEIYNYRELRAELGAAGAQLRSNSDTEVLLHLFQRDGREMLQRLRGMFAFAIWDAKERALFLARDRVGIKPMYYLHIPGQRLYFASEIKAIIADPRVKRSVDPRALMQYLYFGHSSAPLTMFAGIEKLPAAHWMEAKGGQLSVRRYWDVLDAASVADRGSASHVVRGLLGDAVTSHMVSDVPVGAFLSGGIDSSAVVALMSDVAAPVHTFSVGFDVGGRYNELDDATRIARKFGAIHHQLTVSYGDAIEQIEKLVYHYDEPFADAAGLPTYLVSRFAREHVKVVMSGEGSDELLGGYRRYVLESLANRIQSASPRARRVAQTVLSHWSQRRAVRRLMGFLNESPPAERYGRFLAQMDWGLVARLLRPEVLDATDGYDPLWKYKESFQRASHLDHVNRLLYTDFNGWMVDTYLEKVDKASMAVGLEARVPFLDHKLAEAAFRISGAEKIRGFVTKRPLKRALVGTLPIRTLVKPKHGFAVPLDEWFRGPLRSFVNETLLAPDARATEWLDADTIKEICRAHVAGTRANGTAIWILLNFELWLRQFLN